MSIIDEIRQRVPDSWWQSHGPAIEAAIARSSEQSEYVRKQLLKLLDMPEDWSWEAVYDGVKAIKESAIAKMEAAHAKERADMDEHLRDAMRTSERRWDMIHYLAQFMPRADPQWQAIQDELDSGEVMNPEDEPKE